MISPKISIVLPTYNGADFLAQAIDSILNQTMSDFELIIVDDASTDKTPDIIADYVRKDKRIHSIRNPYNQHIATSLNNGFKVAKGKYLTWTSDDNLYRPRALAVLSDYLDEHPEVDLVYSDWTKFNVVSGIEERMHFDTTPKDILENCIVGPCFMYRSQIAQKVGAYDSMYPLVQDYDYWLRFYLEASFATLPEDLYIYRLHPNCLTEQKKQQLWHDTNIVWDRYIPVYIDRFPELLPQFGGRYHQLMYKQCPSQKTLELIKQDIGIRATYHFLKEQYKMLPDTIFLKHMGTLGIRYRMKALQLKLRSK